MSELMLDRAGRRRSPATLPGFHAGQAPGNKGRSSSPKVTWTRLAARCSCGAARAGAAGKSAWTPGRGKNCNPGSSCDASSR